MWGLLGFYISAKMILGIFKKNGSKSPSILNPTQRILELWWEQKINILS